MKLEELQSNSKQSLAIVVIILVGIALFVGFKSSKVLNSSSKSSEGANNVINSLIILLAGIGGTIAAFKLIIESINSKKKRSRA